MGIFIQSCPFFISNRGYTAIDFNASIANRVCGNLSEVVKSPFSSCLKIERAKRRLDPHYHELD